MHIMVRVMLLGALAAVCGNAYAAEPQFPMDVACILSMEKANTRNPLPIEAQPRSCNDFIVANPSEKRLVEAACKFSNSYKGWAYKIVYAPCDMASAYSVCRVPDAKNPDITVDTLYYRSSQMLDDEFVSDKLFEENCKTMAGKYEVFPPKVSE